MGRFYRSVGRVFRVALWIVAVTAGLLLLVYVLLPAIVRRLAVARLEQAGVAVRSLAVRTVGWNRVDLADADLLLAAGVQFESVRVDFDPRRVARDGATRIRVSGAVVTLDLDHPDEMHWPAGGGGTVPPLGRVELAPCRILVRQGGRVSALDAEGEAVQDGERSYRLRLALQGAGGRVTLKGGLRLAGSGLVDSFALEAVLAGATSAERPAIEVRVAVRREGDRLILEPGGGVPHDGRNVWYGEVAGLAGLLFEPSSGEAPSALVADRAIRATLTATNLFATLGAGDMRAASAKAEAEAVLPAAGSPPTWGFRAELHDLELQSGFRVGVPRAALRARGTGGGADSEVGSFSIPVWTLGDSSFAGVSGVVSRVDRRIECHVLGPLLGGAALVARVDPPVAGVARGWRLTGSLPDLCLADCPPLRQALSAAGGWSAEGAVSLEAVAEWPLTPTTPRVDLRLVDVGVRREGLQLSGINGTVRFEGPAPLRTPPRQRLTVRRLAANRVELTDGEILFRVEGDRSFSVDRMGWRWCGGSLACEAFHYGAADDVCAVVAFAENLEVEQILKLVLDDRGTGTGRLYGRIPLLVRLKPRPGLAFGAGYLYAAPGGGTFSLTSREMIANVLKSGFGKAHGKLSIEDDIACTLQNFGYTELAIDIAPSSTSRPHGSLDINGKGLRKDGLPLRLTINFTQDEI